MGTKDDASARCALKRGLDREMLNAPAIYTAPSDEDYVERLNELNCRLASERTSTFSLRRRSSERAASRGSDGWTRTSIGGMVGEGKAQGISLRVHRI